MVSLRLAPFVALCASTVAEPLLKVLQDSGFTEFALQLQDLPALDDGRSYIIYAPSNDALASGNGTARDTILAVTRQGARNLMQVSSNIPQPGRPPKITPPRNNTRSARAVLSGGSALVTLLNNTEFVNLGEGQSLVIVEQTAAPGARPVVVTGLGKTTQVVANDIPFDQGVIRPVNETFTLPQTVSNTLEALGVTKFQSLLQQSGLLAEVDSTAAITVLAPVDSALNSLGNLTDTELTQLLKRHILITYPAYTPILEDSAVYPTLAGGNVTISIQNDVISLNGANIVSGNVLAINGLVHTVDKVLVESPTVTPRPVTGAAPKLELFSWKSAVYGFMGFVAAGFFDLV